MRGPWFWKPLVENRRIEGLTPTDIRDGTHYRIDNGTITWLRDRNGNKLLFTYNISNYLTTITDSLNRQVTITYGAMGSYDAITLKGFGGASRIIKVYRNFLSNALRSDYSLQTFHNLFPDLNGASSDGNYNDSVISAIELPNGQQYHFYYNDYGEVARVVLPTGGATEYDYAPGLTDGATGGVLGTTNGNKHIYRRVVERRAYPDGASGTSYASRMTYSRPESTTSNSGYVTTDQYNSSGALLGRSIHYFYGSALASFGRDTTEYPGWEDGREYQTTIYAEDGVTALRQVTNTFAQRAAVSWWTGSAAAEPPNDPRLVETTTTLMDTNQVSKQTFGYDDSVPFNNQNNVKEYDFGSGAAGSLVRETRTTFVTSTSYTDLGLLGLPSQVSVYDGSGVQRSRTNFEYDNYTADTNHAGLMSLSNISGFDSSFSTSYGTRGNVTSTTHYFLNGSGSETGSIASYAEYDIAGNVVKAIDARGNATTIDFSDNFGAPVESVESSGNPSNTAPSELTGVSAFAFPFKVTNALGQTAYVKFDYYLGRPVTSEDINGIVSRGYYDDALDRPSQMVRAVTGGTDTKSQTTFAYDDTNHVITTTSDQATYNDNVLTSKVLYDGMGRTTERRQYEGTTNYIAVQTQYDALGRAYKSSNPFRPWQSESAIWTTTAFDTLGRVISVTTPDSAVVTTSYTANSVTVTDQTGKARKSVTDGLGRLSSLYEDPAGLNYLTSYSYDTLDNLITVTQGTQPSRQFSYDSLKRLTSAWNPESNGVNYQYDNNGNLTQKSDARSVVTTYVYDALNRATSRSYSDGTPTVTYSYDPAIANGKGRLSSVSSSVSTYSYGNYDALGRVKSATQTIGSQSYSMGYSYDLAGHVTSMTYPSGHIVGYSFDSAGRLTDFNGYLGDGNLRTYSTGIVYSPLGGMTKEQFGTTTPIYNKLFYNSRGHLSEIREGTTYTGATDTGAERGSIINYYSDNCWGMCGGSNSTTAMTDNNGNLKKQEIDVPGVDGFSVQWFTYGALNRLQAANETRHVNSTNQDSDVWRQSYTYDRFGNRTIDQANTTANVPRPAFTVDTNTNRLTVPNGQNGTMHYDAAGNLDIDTYSAAAVSRTYDAENRMTSETQANSYVAGTYAYDGDGRRLKRNVGGVETWQVYGVGGELVAEYAANTAASSPQKEYGYRNGQLLITATITSGWGAAPTLHDNPIVVGETTVQARHITELRDAIDALRSHYNLTAYSWQYSATTNDYISANPIIEMRTALDQALGAPSPAYATGLASGQPIKAIHIQELRDRVLAAWVTSGSTDVRWLVSDQLGTPRMIFDQSGSLAGMSRHDYLPFGEELTAGTGGRTTAQGYSASDGVRQHFTQKERDIETGLDYFKARYYSSTQGRFTSADPSEYWGLADDPQSWNGYAYARNNPLKYQDPDGREFKICDLQGNCENISDDDAKQYTFNKEYQKKNGYYTRGDGKIYGADGSVIGTYENLGCDCWTDTQKRMVRGIADELGHSTTYIFGAAAAIARTRLGGRPVKPVNLPASRNVMVDMVEVATGHMHGGERAVASAAAGKGKSLFSQWMSVDQVESTIIDAYEHSTVTRVQGTRVVLQGETKDGTIIEMWFNREVNVIETAYPIGRKK